MSKLSKSKMIKKPQLNPFNKVLSRVNQGEGNEKSSPDLSKIRARKWFITKHDYDDRLIKVIENLNCVEWAYGKELCPTTKRKHIHVYINYKNMKSLSQLKDIFGNAHIEKAKGNKQQCLKYCSKDGNYKASFKKKREVKYITELRKWQQNVMDIINTEPDDRTVNWFWDEKGATGKTQLAKLLIGKHEAIMVGGKFSDMINGLDNYYEEKKEYPDIVIVNVPRAQQNVSYSGLEALKDGLAVNTKYSVRQHIFPSPHVIVFANFSPNEDALSSDRWNIVNID